MQERIQQDTKEAMKAKDGLRLSVLRMLSAAVHNKEIEKRVKSDEEELTEDEFMAVIRSEAKKRRDAMAEFEKGGRKDLAEKEALELKILETYLPEEISDSEIEKIVREIIAAETFGPNDFGRVMGEVLKKIKGQASGERVSVIVRKALG